MRKSLRFLSTGVGGTIIVGIVSVFNAPAALADTPCPNAVGADPVYVCTTVTPTNIVIPDPVGGTATSVGGQTVGPIGGFAASTPAESVTTPLTPVNTPTPICYALSCVPAGTNVITIPSETVGAPSVTVPVPVLLPATTLPVVPVVVPAGVDAPVPHVYFYNNPVNTVAGAVLPVAYPYVCDAYRYATGTTC